MLIRIFVSSLFVLSDARAWPTTSFTTAYQPARQYRFNFQGVSIEGKITGGYPHGRVFGGPNLAIGPWEEWGTSIRIVWTAKTAEVHDISMHYGL
jgi:hypothetical protein